MLRTVMTVIALGCAFACSSTRAKEDRQNTQNQLERIRDRSNTNVPDEKETKPPPIDKAVERVKGDQDQQKSN